MWMHTSMDMTIAYSTLLTKRGKNILLVNGWHQYHHCSEIQAPVIYMNNAVEFTL